MAANKHIKRCFTTCTQGSVLCIFGFPCMLLLVAVVSGSSVMTTHRLHKPCDSASCYRKVKRPGAACCVEEQKRCKYRSFGHGWSNMVVTNPSPSKKEPKPLQQFTKQPGCFLGACFTLAGQASKEPLAVSLLEVKLLTGRPLGLGFGVWSLGFRVWGLGFGVGSFRLLLVCQGWRCCESLCLPPKLT